MNFIWFVPFFYVRFPVNYSLPSFLLFFFFFQIFIWSFLPAPDPPTQQWHALGREEQAKYYELARKERQMHMQLHPGWTARDNYAQGKKRKRRREKPSEAGGRPLTPHKKKVKKKKQTKKNSKVPNTQVPATFLYLWTSLPSPADLIQQNESYKPKDDISIFSCRISSVLTAILWPYAPLHREADAEKWNTWHFRFLGPIVLCCRLEWLITMISCSSPSYLWPKNTPFRLVCLIALVILVDLEHSPALWFGFGFSVTNTQETHTKTHTFLELFLKTLSQSISLRAEHDADNSYYWYKS